MKGRKMYFGVSSLIGGGVFYFNIEQVSTVRIVHCHKESKMFQTYLEMCEDKGIEPCKNVYFLNVGAKGAKESFLISETKRKNLIKKMKHVMFELPDEYIEIGDEEE